MYPDFLELLRLFESHKVQYAVIGGYAVGLLAEPRYTKELDILIVPSKTNAPRLLAALEDFGAPVDNLTREDIAKPGLLYVFGIPPLRVDILNRIKGADVAGVVRRAIKIPIDNTHINVVSIDDLIVLKKIAGRPQDKADIVKLKQVRISAPSRKITKDAGKAPRKPRKRATSS
jgi:predicted nucleotidyltransferase